MYNLPKAGPSTVLHVAVLVAAALTYPITKLVSRLFRNA